MSTAIPLLSAIALVAAIALAAVGIWAAVELGKAARSTRQLAEDLDGRVPPLADKLDVTVDAFNAELLRVDIMVDQLEGAVDRISGTAETVREVVDAPIHLVSEVAERVRRGFRRRGSHHRDHNVHHALVEAPRVGDGPSAIPLRVLEPDIEAATGGNGAADAGTRQLPTAMDTTQEAIGQEPMDAADRAADTTTEESEEA